MYVGGVSKDLKDELQQSAFACFARQIYDLAVDAVLER
jgi:hypothetical protein